MIQDENALDLLDTAFELQDAPSIEELRDGSLKICVLKSSILTILDTIREILPGSDIDIYYDPFEPTAEDLKVWDYDTAKYLCQRWFVERAERIVRKSWPPARAHYAHYLDAISGSNSLLVPTC